MPGVWLRFWRTCPEKDPPLPSIERLDSLEPCPIRGGAAKGDSTTFEAGFQPSNAHAGGVLVVQTGRSAPLKDGENA